MRRPCFKGLVARLGTAAVLIPLLILMLWWGPLAPVFVLFVGMLALIAMTEFYDLARIKGYTVERAGGMGVGIGVLALAALGDYGLPVLALTIGALALTVLHLLRAHHDFPGLMASVFGVFYVAWLAAHLVLLHGIPVYGPGLATFVLSVVIAADSGAYFAGKYLGRRPLAPVVSPGKTWEGAIGGVSGGIVIALAMYGLHLVLPQLAFPPWPAWQYLLAAAVLVVVSIFGDLFESMIKRDAGVKDAGTLFPGHGGVLDRCDGMLFAAPTLYYGLALLDSANS